MTVEIEQMQEVSRSGDIVSEITTSLLRGLFLLRIFVIDFLRSRKSKGLIILGLFPTIFVVVTGVGLNDPRPEVFYIDIVRTIYITFLIPLFGLLLGTAAISDEIESHTIIQIVSRPIRRVELVVWRYLATIITGTLSSAIMLGGFFAVFAFSILDFGVYLGSVLLAFVCISVYSSIFTLLGIAIKKSLLWGTILILYEQGLGILLIFMGGPALSLSGHILHVGTMFLDYWHGITGWTVAMSSQLLLIMTLASLVFASLLFRFKDLS